MRVRLALTCTPATGSLAALNFIDFQNVVVTESQRFLSANWLFYPPSASQIELNINLGVANMQNQYLLVSWAFSGQPYKDVLLVTSATKQSYRVVLSSAVTSRQVVQIQITNSDRSTFRPIDTSVQIDYMAVVSYVNTGPVPVDCVQTALTATGPCSTRCGTGTQCFTRQTLVSPANGGRACEPSIVCSTCNDVSQCAVDCVISAFGPPSQCSSACGFGVAVQTATVLVYPANGGKPCPSLTKSSLCYIQSCAAKQDCQWGNWSDWSTCSVPCGKGTQSRTRSIALPSTGGGAACTGASVQVGW